MERFNKAETISEDFLDGMTCDSLSTGFLSLDVLTRGGFREGELIVIGSEHPIEARAFIKSFLCHTIINGEYFYKTMIFSLRIPSKVFIKEMIMGQAKAALYPEDIDFQRKKDEIREAASRISDIPIKVYDLKSISTIKHMKALCEEYYDGSVDCIVIDGLDYIENKTGSVQRYFVKLKKMAIKLGCVIILTTSDIESLVENCGNHIPKISDFRCKDIKTYADQILVLTNNDNYKKEDERYDCIMRVHVLRGRALGYIELAYLKAYEMLYALKPDN